MQIRRKVVLMTIVSGIAAAASLALPSWQSASDTRNDDIGVHAANAPEAAHGSHPGQFAQAPVTSKSYGELFMGVRP